MAFFNVDDQFHGHPKPRKAGLDGVGMWTIGGSHCRAYKSDGFVPAWLVESWGRKGRLAALALAESRLWHSPFDKCDCMKGFKWPAEPGWRFHDWDHINDPSEEVERQREQGRERQRKRRQKMREERGIDL